MLNYENAERITDKTINYTVSPYILLGTTTTPTTTTTIGIMEYTNMEYGKVT